MGLLECYKRQLLKNTIIVVLTKAVKIATTVVVVSIEANIHQKITTAALVSLEATHVVKAEAMIASAYTEAQVAAQAILKIAEAEAEAEIVVKVKAEIAVTAEAEIVVKAEAEIIAEAEAVTEIVIEILREILREIRIEILREMVRIDMVAGVEHTYL